MKADDIKHYDNVSNVLSKALNDYLAPFEDGVQVVIVQSAITDILLQTFREIETPARCTEVLNSLVEALSAGVKELSAAKARKKGLH